MAKLELEWDKNKALSNLQKHMIPKIAINLQVNRCKFRAVFENNLE